jgi:hypothetical protein
MINMIFLRKISRGPDLPRTGPIRRESGPDLAKGRGTVAASNLPVGQAGQRTRAAESVRAVPGRSIKSRSTASTRHLRDRGLGQRRS